MILLASAAQAQKHPMTVDDMLAMQRISEAQVSPDGKSVVFTVRTTDMDANKGRNDLWLAAVDGSGARPLTNHPASDSGGRWAPDGKSIYFLSARGGSSQVWRIATDGGEAQPITNFPLDVGNFLVFPDGKQFVVTMEVYPGTSPAETVKRDQQKDGSAVKARVYDELLFRHWDSWEDGKRSHVFTWRPGDAVAVDLMRAMDADSPTAPFGGVEEIAIAPRGDVVAFTAKNVGREAAWSTNGDVWVAPVDGSSQPLNWTEANKALDGSPAFAPQGDRAAWLSMARPGYESDKQTIVVGKLSGATRNGLAVSPLTATWDRSAASIDWSGDGKTIYTTADNLGNHSVFAVDTANGKVTTLLEKGNNAFVGEAGDRLVVLHDELTKPAELISIKKDGSDPRPITHLNDARCSAIEWGPYEQFSFQGAHGDTVYGFVMKPAGFSQGNKYPVAFLVHGGPQGSFGDHFHYRWNPEFYAGRGYAPVFIDFHGSTGYGQKFTDAINGDWGGAPFEDLMKGLDAALAKYPFLDANRCAALGASFGGYMVNWINGNTDRFKCIVSHDGNLDERMAYFDTEELWFPEWEHGGLPWEKAEGYAKHNPIDFVKNWKTPTLVIHGGNDFRVVDTQGMSVFTALQRKGVPSRFLYFPDENHWVLKPQNSKFWHEQVGAWLDKWCH
jgi:dipeptidyl aminopeptidase/acylaminoacyl peptidase